MELILYRVFFLFRLLVYFFWFSAFGKVYNKIKNKMIFDTKKQFWLEVKIEGIPTWKDFLDIADKLHPEDNVLIKHSTPSQSPLITTIIFSGKRDFNQEEKEKLLTDFKKAINYD